MPRYRSFDVSFKRQAAQEFLTGESLNNLSRKYDVLRRSAPSSRTDGLPEAAFTTLTGGDQYAAEQYRRFSSRTHFGDQWGDEAFPKSFD